MNNNNNNKNENNDKHAIRKSKKNGTRKETCVINIMKRIRKV